MKDAEFRRERARIRRFWLEMRDRLGTRRWVFKLEYSDERKNVAGGDGCNVCADCYARCEYEEATITFYVPKVAELSDEELKECIAHEVHHAWVNEMRAIQELPRDIGHEERVVTVLAAVNEWAWQDGYRVGLKAGRRGKGKKKRRAG